MGFPEGALPGGATRPPFSRMPGPRRTIDPSQTRPRSARRDHRKLPSSGGWRPKRSGAQGATGAPLAGSLKISTDGDAPLTLRAGWPLCGPWLLGSFALRRLTWSGRRCGQEASVPRLRCDSNAVSVLSAPVSTVEKLRRVLEANLDDPRLIACSAELFALDPGHPDAADALRRFYEAHIDDVRSDGRPPDADLTKFVPIDRFVVYYANADVRAEYLFGSPRDAYEREISAETDPAQRLTADLPVDQDATLIDACYSWMIPTGAVDGFTADSIVARLRLQASAPLVALDMPTDDASAAGVRVRPPCGIDTIPSMDETWVQGAVPEELIDENVLRRACVGARWLP